MYCKTYLPNGEFLTFSTLGWPDHHYAGDDDRGYEPHNQRQYNPVAPKEEEESYRRTNIGPALDGVNLVIELSFFEIGN